jgi:hypothetical protein
MRWGMMTIIIAGAIWVMFEVFRRFSLIGVGSQYRMQETVTSGD